MVTSKGLDEGSLTLNDLGLPRVSNLLKSRLTSPGWRCRRSVWIERDHSVICKWIVKFYFRFPLFLNLYEGIVDKDHRGDNPRHCERTTQRCRVMCRVRGRKERSVNRKKKGERTVLVSRVYEHSPKISEGSNKSVIYCCRRRRTKRRFHLGKSELVKSMRKSCKSGYGPRLLD